MKLCFILITAALCYAEATFKHRDVALVLCSDTEGEYMIGLDGEEMWYADFKQKKGVMTLPQFADPYQYVEGTYESAVNAQEICKQSLKVCVEAYKSPAEPKDAPQSSIYSKDEVELGSKNTLICYINGFYPAHVGVSWTKNNEKVMDGVSLSRYYLNTDGTFSLVSSLSFTPDQGDLYTCSVTHAALPLPLTKTWEVDVEVSGGVGATVFCGVGLVVGLLGVAVGTFFLVKGNNCN